MSASAGRRVVAVVARALAAAGRARALDRAFSVANGDWNSAGSWTPNGVPRGRRCRHHRQRQRYLNSNTSIAGLVISGGTLTGSGTLTVTATGPVAWSGGAMTGSGATLATAGIVLSGSAKTLSQRTLTLSGGAATLDGPSSYVLLSTGAILNNQITLDCLNDGGHTNQQGFFTGSCGGTFNNSSALRKTATDNTGATVVSVLFNNTGGPRSWPARCG